MTQIAAVGEIVGDQFMKSRILLTHLLALTSWIAAISPYPVAAEDTASIENKPKLKLVLEKNLDVLARALGEPKVIDAVKAANDKHQGISPAAIEELDKRWAAAKGVDDFIKPFLVNECAQYLSALQDEQEGFVEIFVTDATGLNVCQTGKTSDYYQADEEWWKRAWAEGKGTRYFGKIEYDQSAHSEAIPVFVPVYEPLTGKPIGVAKAVIDITVIKREM